ncbi:hypothetical protein M433DRAFT_156870 [Acidomyces richmondensis BFW]|nr:MAG: hypothetical protein FE78DRAFT_93810 [Acidomyces sp. 'richmondensis']KYG43338.1 hypothetical protein M433DRAFT_156870 [Acidomyces richmondensis BFW]
MAKGKSKKGANRQNHLHARISFLHQAATYLTLSQQCATENISKLNPEADRMASNTSSEGHVQVENGLPLHNELKWPLGPEYKQELEVGSTKGTSFTKTGSPSCSSGAFSSTGLQFHLTRHMRQVAQRATIRVPKSIKHTICKCCGAILIPNATSNQQAENRSRGGKKPWADVLLVECRLCGATKRFPVGARRQVKKVHRLRKSQKSGAEDGLHATGSVERMQTVPNAKF